MRLVLLITALVVGLVSLCLAFVEIRHRLAMRNLVKKYIAFYNRALRDRENTRLTEDELKAIGQNVLDGIFEKAFNNAKVPEYERAKRRLELENHIKQRVPDTLNNTPLIFTKAGFVKKKTNNKNDLQQKGNGR